MRRWLPWPLLVAAALAASAADAPAASGGRETRCARALLGMAGDQAAMALGCEAGHARRGGAGSKPCGLNAFAALARARRRGRERCGDAGFAASGRALITNLLGRLRPLMRPDDAANRCAAGKLRAAGRRARAGLRCAARSWDAGDAAAGACRADALERLQRAFARVERRTECRTSNDAAIVNDSIEGFIAELITLVAGGGDPTARPSGLTATVERETVRLMWTAPASGSQAATVRLLRRLNAVPADPTDSAAALLYAGPGTSFADAVTDLRPDTSDQPHTYHYAVFGCSAAGDACEAAGSRTTLALTLVDALRAGGYVLYWRHASADVCSDRVDLGPAASTTYPDWWKRCDASCPGTATARQLNADGVREATAIGDAFRRLGIPVGRVISSEFCRNVSTAELMAFGPPIEQEPAITYFVHDEANRCARAHALLARPPAPGTNTALIGHTGFSCPVLDELAWAEAAVYRPDAAGSAEYFARVPWEAWDEGR